MNTEPRDRFGRVRSIFVGSGALVAVALFGFVLDDHYAIETWIFWKYAKAVALSAFWSTACLSFGFGTIQRVAPALPLRERLVLATAAGVYGFYVLHFSGGILGVFGPSWALLLPFAMLAAGLYGSRAEIRRLWRHRHHLPRFTLGVSSGWQVPIAVFGVACLLGIYLGTLTPRNTAFDSLWYHLGLGQGWAAEGAISRSVEGWFVEALPNLAAVLYSWAFLVPGLDLFETIMLAAHIELALFVATLASIPVLVRWLLPGTRVGVSWVALFLFPSVFLYDAGLHTGNDHVAAFWAVPIAIAFRHAWPSLDGRSLTLLALFSAGAILTKYQAAALVLGPAVAILARAAYLAAKRAPPRAWVGGPLIALAAGVVFTTPLWMKNWIWYGDPLFPALHHHLELRPWSDEMSAVMERNWSRLVRRPRGTLGEKLADTLRTGWEFSFRSFTRGRFHGQMPYFGSLFTLSALWLPFVRGAKRTWAVFALAMAGVLFWFNFSHVERYLQSLIPWMAAVVAAAVVLGWRTGPWARIPIVLVVLLQVVWGGDALFIRSHAMMGDLPMVHSARLIESGFKGTLELREKMFGALQQIGDELPEDAVVLLHGHNPRLGLRARVVTDMGAFQSLIRYGSMESLEEIHALYEELGITHIVWRRSRAGGGHTLAGDLRFHDYALNEVPNPKRVGSMSWAPVPSTPPSSESNDLVLYAGCLRPFEPGIYRLSDLNALETDPDISPLRPLPDDADELAELVEEVGFIVHGPRCKKRIPRPPTRGFVRVAKRKREELWVRRR